MMRRFALICGLLFSLTVPAGAAFADCVLTSTGQTRPPGTIVRNTAFNVLQYCAGTEWKAMVWGVAPDCADDSPATCVLDTTRVSSDPQFTAPNICAGINILGITGTASCGGAGDDTPDAFSFTDQTNVALSTLTTSNIVQIAGITGSVATSISGGGSPEYRICSDGTSDANCDGSVVQNWTSGAASINNNQYLQLRLTSSASNSTMLSATITVGTGSDQWNVTTLAGSGCGVTSGLVGYWKFDEGTGTTAADSSGSGNTLSFPGGSGNPTWSASGKLSNALLFDGVNDRVFRTSPNSFPGAGSYTVATWFKPTANISSGFKRIINTMGTGGDWATGNINLLIGDGVLACYFPSDNGGDEDVTSSPSTWTAGTWYHAACTFNSATETFTLYVNGAQVDQNTGVGVPDDPGGQLFLGAGDFGSAERCNCTLDDSRIYNRALSGAEVSDLYNGGAGCSD